MNKPNCILYKIELLKFLFCEYRIKIIICIIIYLQRLFDRQFFREACISLT